MKGKKNGIYSENQIFSFLFTYYVELDLFFIFYIYYVRIEWDEIQEVM